LTNKALVLHPLDIVAAVDRSCLRDHYRKLAAGDRHLHLFLTYLVPDVVEVGISQMKLRANITLIDVGPPQSLNQFPLSGLVFQQEF
jgi:hypothetical protein